MRTIIRKSFPPSGVIGITDGILAEMAAESRLRTYMLGGVSPEELEREAGK
jgi:hypothetical protein